MGGRSYDRLAQPFRGTATGAKKRKPAKTSRGLNALEIAEQENPDVFKIRQHRLGEVDDDPTENRMLGDVDDRSAKRRKIENTSATSRNMEEDEDLDSASDSEGNHWHTGVVGEDEDSDIDSDEAFGESDEERFDGFTFRGSSNPASKSSNPKQKRTTKKLDLSEGTDEMEMDEGSSDGSEEIDQEEHDDLGDEAVDLATALDMNEEADQEEADIKSRRKSKDKTSPDQDTESDDSSEEDNVGSSDENSGQEESHSDFSISDDEDGGHNRLQRFVESISSKKVDNDSNLRSAVRNLPDKPSQFGLASTKISASELLELVKDPAQRKALKVLQSNEKKAPEVSSKGVPGRLAAPLAKRQQDRLDRSAAYDQSKKELGKWIDTVKENRRAEHLSFPLAEPGDSSYSTEQFAPLTQSKPVNPLETAINTILEESGLAAKNGSSLEDQERQFEELQEKKLPLAEVQARRAELRKARDLMFREEIRAKRIKKIKSKAYRRVHRKERDRIKQLEQAQLEAHGMIDSEEERERNDRRRAEERMGARHRESKWAKGVKQVGRAGWDEDARQGVVDLARRDEELRRRIEGKVDESSNASDDGVGESDSDEFSDSDDENQALQARLDTLGSDAQNHAYSRLSNMAFMQKAEAAKKTANDAEIRKIKLGLEGDNDYTQVTTTEDSELKGRQKYGTQAKVQPKVALEPSKRNEFEAPLSEDEIELEQDTSNRDQDLESTQLPKSIIGLKQSALESRKPVQKVATDKSNTATVLNKHNKQAPSGPAKSVPRTPASQQALDNLSSSSDDDDSDDAEDVEPVAEMSLAEAIFAGPDDAVQEFRKEKRITAIEEDDQVQDNSLPGWGSWTGVGVSKREQKKAQLSGRFATVTKGVKADKRQDAKLDRVIINEKRIKKNSKYLASELPHPFESRQQYERAMRLPLGPEWTTKSTFQDATKPRVIMKQGVILPMARPTV